MSELRQAAQAVLDRWDSPQWEWRQHGPTADLMADLRAALAQPPAPTAQPAESATGQPLRAICWANCPCRKAAQPVQQPEPEVDGWPLYSGLPPAQRRPLSDMQIFAATHAEMDSLLDHICDEGTASIGVKRRLCHFAHVIQRECAAAWGVTLAASPNTGEAK